MSDWLRRCCERAERRDMAVMHRRGVRKVARVLACGLGLVLCGLGGNIAQGEDPTPIAGEEFRTTLFGEEIYVPPRDRRSGVIGTTTTDGSAARSPEWSMTWITRSACGSIPTGR